jgi:hypothetical protein
MNELNDEFIDSLLVEAPKSVEFKPTEVKRSKPAIKFSPENEQTGPIRYYDKEMRCASRGCSAPTYIKINGIAKCYAHALRDANTMLQEAGFR